MPSKRKIAAVLLAAFAASRIAPAEPDTWLPADPEQVWSFPRDLYAHPHQKTEWWYLTGIVMPTDDPSRLFGFELTFFRLGLRPQAPDLDSAWATNSVVMVHLALTDVKSGHHLFSEVLYRSIPLLGGFGAPPDPVIAFARAPAGTDALWTLSLERDHGTAFHLQARDDAKGVFVDLSARTDRPPVLEGPNGFSRKSDLPGYASLYFSYPRLATAGVLAVGESRYSVNGTSWMDREFGSSELAPNQVGWDWFGLRLSDGRDLMLYVLRKADGTPDHKAATLVARNGSVRSLGSAEWNATPLSQWKSEVTQATYPSGWSIDVPSENLHIRVVPSVAGAENVSSLVPGLAYFEGPVQITDSAGANAGEGYVELTGYGKLARPPI